MLKYFLSSFLLAIMTFSGSAYCEPVVAGPIEITPINATVVMHRSKKGRDLVGILSTIKFSIKNTSSSDIKVILITTSLEGFDNLNQKLFKDHSMMASSGVKLSSLNIKNNDQVFINDKWSFVSLSPGQKVQAYIFPLKDGWGYSVNVEDPSGDFYKTHRPQTMTFNGAIGIMNVDGSSDIRTFSLSDIPVSLTLR